MAPTGTSGNVSMSVPESSSATFQFPTHPHVAPSVQFQQTSPDSFMRTTQNLGAVPPPRPSGSFQVNRPPVAPVYTPPQVPLFQMNVKPREPPVFHGKTSEDVEM